MADKFQLKAIISAVDKITPTLKGVQRAARMTSKTLRDIGRSGRNLMGSLGLPAGLAFGSVIYGATRAASAALQYAGSVQDAAARTGASTTEYQTLVAMLEQVGGSAEDAEMAFTQFNKGISNADAGVDKSFAALLNQLKIPIRDAKGNVRSLADMMPELADAFEKNTDHALRTRMAMELFGKSGSKLIPILKGGRKAYAEYIAEQERLGIIIGDKSIGALDDMGDSLGVLNKQMKVQLTESLARMVPAIMPIIKSMQEWIAKNKELIQTTLTKTLTEIVIALKGVDWVAFIKGIRDTIKGIGSFIEMMGGMKSVLIALGVIWLAGPLLATAQLIGAVGRLGLAFGAMALKAVFASAEMLAFGAHAAALSTGLTASFLAMAKSAALLAAAGAVGYAIGSIIWKGIEGTRLADKIGESVAGVLAFFGNEDAKEALQINQRAEGVRRAQAAVPPEVVRSARAAAPPEVVRSARAAAPPEHSREQASAPPPLTRSGTPLPAPSPLMRAMSAGQVSLNGEMVVRFENAPPGMRADPGKTNQPGVSMNPDVGYRSLSFAG